MNVAYGGTQIILLYLKMNFYILISLRTLTKVNQICSIDGQQYISISEKGAYIMIILNIIAFIYIKAKDKMQISDNFLLAFINICWGIIQFMKNYQLGESNPNECLYVINSQQVTFYFQVTTTIWVLLANVFSQIVCRITSLPINCICIYLVFVNQQQHCLDDNIYYLIIFATLWMIILGVPYNFFMSANKKINGPYLFLTSIGILIQIPICYFIYNFGLNYKNDECQTTYSAQEIYMVISSLQLIMLFTYFVYFKKFEQEKKKQEISKELVNLTTTTKLSTTLYTQKR